MSIDLLVEWIEIYVFVEKTSDAESQTPTTVEVTGEYNSTESSANNTGNLTTAA